MLRSDLVAALASRFYQLVTRDSEVVVNTILASLTHALATGKRAEIRGFGSFCLVYRRSRTGRNPLTGEKVIVPAKHVLLFRPGKELRHRVDPSISTARNQ